MKIKWHVKLWRPYGKTIGRHWKHLYQNPDALFYSELFGADIPHNCPLTRHRAKGGKTHYTAISRSGKLYRAGSLREILEIARKSTTGELP
jgi:hypothetical protein